MSIPLGNEKDWSVIKKLSGFDCSVTSTPPPPPKKKIANSKVH